jgi:hypothetical protein
VFLLMLLCQWELVLFLQLPWKVEYLLTSLCLWGVPLHFSWGMEYLLRSKCLWGVWFLFKSLCLWGVQFRLRLLFLS